MQIAFNCITIVALCALSIQNAMHRQRLEALEFITYDLLSEED